MVSFKTNAIVHTLTAHLEVSPDAGYTTFVSDAVVSAVSRQSCFLQYLFAAFLTIGFIVGCVGATTWSRVLTVHAL